MSASRIALTLALLACPALAGAQDSVAPQATPLQDAPVSGQDGLHAVTLSIAWPAGAVSRSHTHPGDEYAIVLAGEITLTSAGQPDRVVKAGEAYHNERGLVHEARSTGDVPARTIAVLVVDKGSPLVQPQAD